MSEQKQIVLRNETDLKVFLATNYMNQIKNFFGDEKQAMKFLSSVMASVQKLPKLLDCQPMTIVNSFMTMAQLGLMPSDVSGEAYVLPYGDKAQFQLGYQGLITLFYRAGGSGIRTNIVREKDEITMINGKIQHKVNMFQSNADRGQAIGAYAIADVNGQEISKYMHKTDILDMGKKFSKSFNTDFSPWKEKNDPEGWMWQKTVLKQLMKLLPKNETINRAISLDNEDSIIADRLEAAKTDSEPLKMGNILTTNEKTNTKKDEKNKESKDEVTSSVSDEVNPFKGDKK